MGEEEESEEEEKIVDLKAQIEALIFATRGVSIEQLSKWTGRNPEELQILLEEIRQHFLDPSHGVELKKMGQFYRFYTKANCADLVAKSVKNVYSKLTSSQLEVIAAVILNGPCSKQTIDEMRGRDSYFVLKSLHKMGILRRKRSKKNAYLYEISDAFKDSVMLEEMLDLEVEHSENKGNSK